MLSDETNPKLEICKGICGKPLHGSFVELPALSKVHQSYNGTDRYCLDCYRSFYEHQIKGWREAEMAKLINTQVSKAVGEETHKGECLMCDHSSEGEKPCPCKNHSATKAAARELGIKTELRDTLRYWRSSHGLAGNVNDNHLLGLEYLIRHYTLPIVQ